MQIEIKQFGILFTAVLLISCLSIQRGHADGELDTSFGTGGQTILTDSSFLDFHVFDILFQGDKILVFGLARSPNQENTFFYARFLPNGNLDETFGNNPQLAALFSTPPEFEKGFFPVASGYRLVVSGATIGDQGQLLTLVNIPNINNLSFFTMSILRISADGVLAFTDGGAIDHAKFNFFASAEFPQFPDDAFARDIRTQADGKVLFFGSLGAWQGGGLAQRGFVARLNRDGRPDSSFADNGFTELLVGSSSFIGEVALLDDGSLAIGGTYRSPLFSGRKGYVAKLTSSGTPDPTFGDNGVLTLENLRGEIFEGVAGARDGGIYSVWSFSSFFSSFVGPLVKSDQFGRFDPGFGDGGVLKDIWFSWGLVNGLDVLEDGNVMLFLTRFPKGFLVDKIGVSGNRNLDLINDAIDFDARLGIMRIRPDGAIFVAGPEPAPDPSAPIAGFRLFSLKNSVPPLNPRFFQGAVTKPANKVPMINVYGSLALIFLLILFGIRQTRN